MSSSAPQPLPPTAATICANCSMELDNDMPSTLSTSLAKDTRSREHDRQRAKKAVGHTKAREHKEVKGTIRSRGAVQVATSTSKCSCCRPPVDKTSRRSLGKRDTKGLREREINGEDEVRTPEVSPVRGSRVRAPSTAGIEVKLVDLLAAKRPRKVKAGDFEVIPNVKSVIALDESASEIEVDEPWEHIYGSDDERPSYAEIAATRK